MAAYALVQLNLTGRDKPASGRLMVQHWQPRSLLEQAPFDEDATAEARKGSALLSAAAAGDVEAVAAALEGG